MPPSPPASAGEPLTLVSPLGNLYLTVEDERVAGQLLHDVYDEWDDHRQPTVSWCFSFMMLIMFMMILQSTMTVPVPDSTAGGGPGAGAGAGGAPSPSAPSDPSAAAAAAGTAAAGLLAGFSLFVVWVVSKLFLVVLPLLMVMRLAARAQVRHTRHTCTCGTGADGLDYGTSSRVLADALIPGRYIQQHFGGLRPDYRWSCGGMTVAGQCFCCSWHR